jgi:hypothetical protein
VRNDSFRADRSAVDKLDRARGSFSAYEEPNKLPDPIPDLGYEYQWIAVTLGGNDWLENVDKMFRDKWVPVRQDEQPHIMMLREGRSYWIRNGCIEIGGLLLCKKPDELVAQKIRHYENLVEGRLNSFRDQVFAMSRREMPLEGEWRSYAETGRDFRVR